jgi:hypothetical protein
MTEATADQDVKAEPSELEQVRSALDTAQNRERKLRRQVNHLNPDLVGQEVIDKLDGEIETLQAQISGFSLRIKILESEFPLSHLDGLKSLPLAESKIELAHHIGRAVKYAKEFGLRKAGNGKLLRIGVCDITPRRSCIVGLYSDRDGEMRGSFLQTSDVGTNYGYTSPVQMGPDGYEEDVLRVLLRDDTEDKYESRSAAMRDAKVLNLWRMAGFPTGTEIAAMLTLDFVAVVKKVWDAFYLTEAGYKTSKQGVPMIWDDNSTIAPVEGN